MALVIATITAVGVIVAAIASIRAANSTKKQGLAQLMEGFEDSFKELMSREDRFLKKGEVPDIVYSDSYATDYLNTLDRLAFYKNENMIEKKLIKFFTSFLSWGLILMEWKERVHGKKFDEQYSNFIKLCKDEKIKKVDWDVVPYQLKYLATYYENERTKEEAKKKEEEAKTQKENSDNKSNN